MKKVQNFAEWSCVAFATLHQSFIGILFMQLDYRITELYHTLTYENFMDGSEALNSLQLRSGREVDYWNPLYATPVGVAQPPPGNEIEQPSTVLALSIPLPGPVLHSFIV